ncbi:MAG: DinB family protein [Actinomycetota bacterium]|nr:DinB family protein [Actinomycetota bacterium]
MSAAKASPETERAGLFEFLGYKRQALTAKLQGLSEEQARMTPTASSLSLLSLVKHSAIWERRWFQVIVAGRSFPGEWPEVRSEEEDSTFRLTDEDTVETVVADYREQIAASNEILGTFDLEAPCAWPEMAEQNLRWVALHMIEETAHHAGHADIIRETIDGSRWR